MTPAADRGAGRPVQVRRRHGELVPFDADRIRRAVTRAAEEVGADAEGLADRIADLVTHDLAETPRSQPPGVEEIQDAVERRLMAEGLVQVARAYVLYRRRRAELREAKALLEVRDELKLSLAAVTVLKERYLLHDERGRPTESTAGMVERVAQFVAGAEDIYQSGSSARWAERFADLLASLDFLPNSPTLMNAGTPVGLLSGCVVLPVEDSLRSIFATLGQAALIHQAGGGTGYSFSHLRPAGDVVTSTGGKASGPVSFLNLYDAAAGVIRQGGRRRGASMAVLDISHPDIFEFVTAKSGTGQLPQFNLSVGVTDAFVRAVRRNGRHRLVNPRTGRTTATVPAMELFEAICQNAHRFGDPGLLFLDTINRANPLPSHGRIEATNPCGEVPLEPYESCNLGSVNLARMVVGGKIDWDRLTATVHVAVRFLDDVIDVSAFPFAELGQGTLASRKIGLGMMGLAELLASLGIPYDSEQAVRLAGRLARQVNKAARDASAQLAGSRGPFPLFAQSTLAGSTPLRHSQRTSVAPTGTISLIAGTTAGIEPMFAVAFTRNVLGRHLVEVNPLFERLARRRGFYSDQLMTKVAATGGVRSHPEVPEDVRRAFPTALEIEPHWHLAMQAAVQRHVDAAVSKTINLPASATLDQVRSVYLDAWRARVKGITVYRYGSQPGQVLTLVSAGDGDREPPVHVETAFSGGCAGHLCEF